MTATREAILAAVRGALGRDKGNVSTIDLEAASLLEAPELIRPSLPELSRSAVGVVELFAEQVILEKIGGTLQRVPALAGLPGAVAKYLAAQGLPAAVALQPVAELRGLDWSGIEIRSVMAPDEAAGVDLARWGIAETGSLVFHSGPDTPVLFHFLPLHHIVALRASTIVAYLEDYVRLAAQAGPPPRNVNIVTGASGTTDIEGSYVRGAHGPGFLHVVLVEDS